MPETENDKTVELDVTGPGANVELPDVQKKEDRTYEKEEKKNEANVTYDDQPADTSEKSSEQSNVRDSEDVKKSEVLTHPHLFLFLIRRILQILPNHLSCTRDLLDIFLYHNSVVPCL